MSRFSFIDDVRRSWHDPRKWVIWALTLVTAMGVRIAATLNGASLRDAVLCGAGAGLIVGMLASLAAVMIDEYYRRPKRLRRQ